MTEKRRILAVAAVLFCASAATAQTTVATSGGEAGTVSFTVGQPFYETATSDAGSLAAGVQQAYTISVVDGIENTQISLEAEVYPNPVTDRLNLRVVDASDSALHYTLPDTNGRTLEIDDIQDALSAIDMSQFVQGVYFLRVDNGERVVKTFKIVKN